MTMEGLPIGQGAFEVYGIPATEREDNTGLRADQQRVSNREMPVYRTDDEEEAKRLVREGGFTHQGQYYATTRYVNASAETTKANIASKSGTHVRSPKGQLPIQAVPETAKFQTDAIRKDQV